MLPKRLDDWSLTSGQQRRVKTGGRLIKHARYDCRCQGDEAETLALQKRHPEKTQGARIIQLSFHNHRLCYCGGCGFSSRFRCSS